MQYTNSTQMEFLQFGKVRLRSIMKSQLFFLYVKGANAAELLEYELRTVCVLYLCSICVLYVYYMCTACGLPLARRGAATAECCDERACHHQANRRRSCEVCAKRGGAWLTTLSGTSVCSTPCARVGLYSGRSSCARNGATAKGSLPNALWKSELGVPSALVTPSPLPVSARVRQ